MNQGVIIEPVNTTGIREAHIVRSTGRHAEPIVLKAGRKKKRRYSRRLKDFQVRLRDVSKTVNRMASSIADGVKKYRDRADKSSRKKKDGMLRDLLKNTALGMGKSLRVASKLPKDVADVFSGKKSRRRIRKLARLVSMR